MKMTFGTINLKALVLLCLWRKRCPGDGVLGQALFYRLCQDRVTRRRLNLIGIPGRSRPSYLLFSRSKMASLPSLTSCFLVLATPISSQAASFGPAILTRVSLIPTIRPGGVVSESPRIKQDDVRGTFAITSLVKS